MHSTNESCSMSTTKLAEALKDLLFTADDSPAYDAAITQARAALAYYEAEAKPAEPFVTSADSLATQLRGYAVAVQDEQPYWADKIKAACDELEAQAEAKPAPAEPVPALGWTGNADADLALILLDRLDDEGEGNAVRIEQLEDIVRNLAAAIANAKDARDFALSACLEAQRLAAAPAAPAPEPVPEGMMLVERGWFEKNRADWYRFHDLMKAHRLHPGRTDDSLIDILADHLAAPAPAKELSDDELDALIPQWRHTTAAANEVCWQRRDVRQAMRAAIAASKGEK